MPRANEYDGWAYAPLRLSVWILAAVYLGRIYYDNTLWDLRQITPVEFAVKTFAIAVVLAFAYWNLVLADPDLMAMIWGVALFFAAKVLLVAGVVRLGGALADYEQRKEQRRFEAAADPDD